MGTKDHASKSQRVKEIRAEYVPSRGAQGKHAASYRQSPIIEKCKATLAKHYGKRLKGVVLYGSLARGQAGPASDIDLLVLLSPPLDYFVELRSLVDVLYPIQLESERLISAKPVSVDEFELGSISLYRNARREGVLVQ
jgi:predicted nucleotidyltransferase